MAQSSDVANSSVTSSDESNSSESERLSIGPRILNITAETTHDKRIKLIVEWAPSEEISTNVYDVEVQTLNVTRERECETHFFHTVDADTTSLEIGNEQPNHETPVSILPDCSYKVIVRAHHGSGDLVTSRNYTVPECVGEGSNMKCSCHEILYKPTIFATQVSNSSKWRNYNVTWSFGNQSHLMKESEFRIGESVQQVSASGKPIYRFEKEDLIPHHRQEPFFKTLQISKKKEYIVTVRGKNRKECWGDFAEELFPVDDNLDDLEARPKQSDDNTQQYILVTVLPTASFVIALFLCLMMVWQKCGVFKRKILGHKRELQPVTSWRGLYRPIESNHLGRPPRSYTWAEEWNPVYVPKEIEEARIRGEADKYEISYSSIQFGPEIGKGTFGRVLLARANAINGHAGVSTVAVKKLKSQANSYEKEEFLWEISMMKKIGKHPNVVRLLGCCTLKEPHCMIMEYVPCGDLLQYLRRLRWEYEKNTGKAVPFATTMRRNVLSPRPGKEPKSPLPRYVDVIVDQCCDNQQTGHSMDPDYIVPDGSCSCDSSKATEVTSIASSGRPSISSERQWKVQENSGSTIIVGSGNVGSIPHSLEYILDPKELQDFAMQIARGMAHLETLGITHRDLAARNVLIDESKILKISDFGLSRSGIYINTRTRKVPWRWLSIEAMRDNLYSTKSDVWAFAIVLWEIGTLGGFPYPTIADGDLLPFVLGGNRLEKPENCTDELYSLMLACWSHDADNRPTFSRIQKHLESMGQRRRAYIDFGANYIFPPTERESAAKIKGSKSSESRPSDNTVQQVFEQTYSNSVPKPP